jgi:SAM-dependent methyltransferase
MIRTTLARIGNGVRRIAARLPRSQEAVWPGVPNDLFVAHQSVYRFAAQLAPGQRILDAACGTGYGSHLLALAGAASVLGIDIDARRVSYARRNFEHPALRFAVLDVARLQLHPRSVDLVVSSNTLEHLARPVDFLEGAGRCLAPDGCLLVTVPPVLSAADLVEHGSNRFHSSPLSVRAWADLFHAQGWSMEVFTHYCSEPLDLRSPFPSTVDPSSFDFVPCSLEQAYLRPPISVTYRLRRAG